MPMTKGEKRWLTRCPGCDAELPDTDQQKMTMLTATQVVELLKDEAEKAGTQKAAVQAMGVSASFLSDIILGKREPTGKVLEHLGLVKTVAYVRRA